MNEHAKKLLDSPRAAHATAGLAIAIAAIAAVGGRGDSPVEAPRGEPMQIAPVDAGVRVAGKRLDVATDIELASGATITASGKVGIGARLVSIDTCIGHYDEATRICVLAPGPWQLHSACFERASSTSGNTGETVCEVIVRNTGSVPLKFSGYVEVAAP
jgi:hypothetical protein